MADAWSVEITREPEWSEQDRDEAEALYLLPPDKGLCDCGCGWPAELTNDPQHATPWSVEIHQCEYSRQMAIAQRLFDKEHENDQPSRVDGSLPTDGVTLSLRPPGEE